jgi:hypothetical protein
VAYQELGAPLLSQPLSATNELVKVYDPEVGRQNPSEEKQLKLARGVNRGLIDKDLKVRVPASRFSLVFADLFERVFCGCYWFLRACCWYGKLSGGCPQWLRTEAEDAEYFHTLVLAISQLVCRNHVV